jgi:hypothetical protein
MPILGCTCRYGREEGVHTKVCCINRLKKSFGKPRWKNIIRRDDGGIILLGWDVDGNNQESVSVVGFGVRDIGSLDSANTELCTLLIGVH